MSNGAIGSEPMSTLSIKVPDALKAALESASRRARVSKSEVARRALADYLAREEGGARKPASALARAGDLVGCFEGGPKDLASNPRHMAGFGK
jgi:predicted transcriptional regulator